MIISEMQYLAETAGTTNAIEYAEETFKKAKEIMKNLEKKGIYCYGKEDYEKEYKKGNISKEEYMAIMKYYNSEDNVRKYFSSSRKTDYHGYQKEGQLEKNNDIKNNFDEAVRNLKKLGAKFGIVGKNASNEEVIKNADKILKKSTEVLNKANLSTYDPEYYRG